SRMEPLHLAVEVGDADASLPVEADAVRLAADLADARLVGPVGSDPHAGATTVGGPHRPVARAHDALAPLQVPTEVPHHLEPDPHGAGVPRRAVSSRRRWVAGCASRV